MSEDLTPRDTLQKVLQFWWLPLLVMLAGGLAGYLFHLSRPALYESQVIFTFSFDYARLGKLSDAEEDLAMGAAGEIISATPILTSLLSQSQAQGWVPQDFDFSHQIAVERKSYRWVLRVRNPDPQNARKTAALWAELSLAALKQGSQHAEQAKILQHQLDGLESCLEHMTITEPAAAQCAWPAQADLQREISSLGDQFQNERTASQGMLAGLGFVLSETAQVPAQPSVNDRNTLVLAGGLLGFIAGAALASTGLLERAGRKAARGL
jgi:hypothetical protein